MMNETFANIMFCLFLAFVLTYMVLAAQFESFLHPFTIMLSLPLAVGVYLPLSAMTPVFIGGCIRAFVEWRAERRGVDPESRTEQGVLLGSGLIAGEGLAGVAIALWAFATGSKPAGLGISYPTHVGEALSLGAFALLGCALLRASRLPSRERSS